MDALLAKLDRLTDALLAQVEAQTRLAAAYERMAEVLLVDEIDEEDDQQEAGVFGLDGTRLV